MAGNVTVVLTADERRLLDFYRKLNQEAKKHETALQKIAREAGMTEGQLKRMAERTRDMNLTALERYHREMNKLRAAVRGGVLDMEDFRKAQMRMKADLRSTFDPGIVSRFRTAIASLPAAIGGRLGLGVAGGSAAMGAAAAVGAFYGTDQYRQERSGRLSGTDVRAWGMLQTLAPGDPKRAEAIRGMAANMLARGGGKDMAEVGNTAFMMQSSNMLNPANARLMADLYATQQIENPERLATGLGTFQQAMGPAFPGMSSAVGKGLVSSAKTKLKLEEVLWQASRGAIFAEQGGLNIDELLAATTVLTMATVTRERGGEAMESLSEYMAQYSSFWESAAKSPKFQQKFPGIDISTLGGKIQYLAGKGGKNMNFATLTGDLKMTQPAAQAMMVLYKNLNSQASGAFGSGATYAESLKSIQAAGPEMTQQQMRDAMKNEQVMFGHSALVREGRRRLQEMRGAMASQYVEQYIAEREQKMQAAGAPDAAIWLNTKQIRLESAAAGPEQYLRAVVGAANIAERVTGKRDTFLTNKHVQSLYDTDAFMQSVLKQNARETGVGGVNQFSQESINAQRETASWTIDQFNKSFFSTAEVKAIAESLDAIRRNTQVMSDVVSGAGGDGASTPTGWMDIFRMWTGAGTKE